MQQEKRARFRIDPSDLVLEVISIVIAIVLATAVGQVVGRYRAAAQTHDALEQIRLEIVHDEADLAFRHPIHVRVKNAFSGMLDAAHDERLDYRILMATFGRAAPGGFRPFVGSTTAWELARGSDVLAEVPYGLRATLQRRYAELAGINMLNAGLLEKLESGPAQDRPNFFFTAASASLILSDIVYAEDRIRVDDRAALDTLSAAEVR